MKWLQTLKLKFLSLPSPPPAHNPNKLKVIWTNCFPHSAHKWAAPSCKSGVLRLGPETGSLIFQPWHTRSTLGNRQGQGGPHLGGRGEVHVLVALLAVVEGVVGRVLGQHHGHGSSFPWLLGFGILYCFCVSRGKKPCHDMHGAPTPGKRAPHSLKGSSKDSVIYARKVRYEK